MNNSIYTDVVEWMAKIVKPQKALGNVSICPYAKKASWAIVECEDMKIDVKQCHQEVTIFVLPKSISKAKLESYVLNLKKNHGKEEQRARDLFYGLWIPDLFMKRVEEDGMWSLMCPDLCPGLSECHGKAFEDLYCQYERDGQYVRQMRAREVWSAILESQIETGTPYMLYKDAANAKSNQQNLGTIQCRNLCTEIIQYTDEEEVAVCNLASM